MSSSLDGELSNTMSCSPLGIPSVGRHRVRHMALQKPCACCPVPQTAIGTWREKGFSDYFLGKGAPVLPTLSLDSVCPIPHPLPSTISPSLQVPPELCQTLVFCPFQDTRIPAAAQASVPGALLNERGHHPPQDMCPQAHTRSALGQMDRQVAGQGRCWEGQC